MQTVNKQTVIIDLAQNTEYPVFQFIQHDANIFEFVLKENGVDADINNIGRIVVNYKRPDKEVISRLLLSDDTNIVLYEMGASEMEFAGYADVQLQFFNVENTERISTTRLKVYLASAIGADFKSSEDFTTLQELFQEVDEVRTATNTVKDFAQTQGDYAKAQGDYANTEAGNLVVLKEEVETTISNAETATNAANISATNANDTALFAQTQGDYSKVQGDRAKAEADRLTGTDVSVLDNKINTINTNLTSQLADNAKQFKTEKIRTTAYATKTPLFTIIDDDGYLEALTKLKPLTDARGWKAASAIITNFVGGTGYMTWDQIRSLRDAGWEILSHTKSHANMTQTAPSQQDVEINGSLDTLKSQGFDVKGIVWPYDNPTANAKKLANLAYNYAFGVWGVNDIPIDSMQIARIAISNTGEPDYPLTYFTTKVDDAIANNKWMVLETHMNFITDPNLQILTQLLDYVKDKETSGQIQVVTPGKGYEIFGNIIESRNYETGTYSAVTNTGESYSSGIFRNYEMKTPNGITELSPVTSFKKGRSTIIPFYSADNFGQGAGVLITHRDLTNDDLSFQEWFSLDMKQRWLRPWNTSGGSWYAWRKYYPDGGKYITYDSTSNARTATDLASTFPQGLTVTIITNSTGFPIARSGMLHTYRFETPDAGYQWQEYHAYGKSNIVYRRSTNTSTGDWLGWSRQLIGNQVTYAMTAKTIPANSCLDLIVPFFDVKDYSVLYASPGATALESNVGFNVYYYNDNNCTLRLINPTASPISLAARTWTLTSS